MKNQKGFTLIEMLLLTIAVGIIGFAGYYAWSRNQDKKIEQTEIVQQEPLNTEADGGTESESRENSETSGYTIDLSGSTKPKSEEVAYVDFLATNAGGGALMYNTEDNKFISGELDDTGKLLSSTIAGVEALTTSGDNTAIYVWKQADADTYKDTYAIDLKNGKILKIEFSYSNYDDGINRSSSYMTLDEIAAQRIKDLNAVKTFAFN